MLSNIIRFLFKILVGFTCAVVVLLILLAVAIHVPDKEILERFEYKQAAFEEINAVLRQELEARDRTKMLFDLNFDDHTLTYDGEVVYTGEAVDKLKSFGNYAYEGVTVETDKTLFYYGLGTVAIVYSESGNPGSFAERRLSFVAKSFELADGWYFAENCNLEDED